MKRTILLIFLISAVISCKKEDDQVNNQITQQEVSFAASFITPVLSLKSTDDWECKPYEPDYAQVTIAGVDYFPQLYRIDEVLYTQNIWLDVPAGGNSTTYMVSKFLLWDDGGSPGGTLEVDDTIVMGTPAAGSDYAIYVSKTLDFSIDVNAFHELEVPVEVLCFKDDAFIKHDP